MQGHTSSLFREKVRNGLSSTLVTRLCLTGLQDFLKKESVRLTLKSQVFGRHWNDPHSPPPSANTSTIGCHDNRIGKGLLADIQCGASPTPQTFSPC